jgi:DNA polymerase I-like protein with 3'-5' exonuclease and polymerase domains
MPWVETSSLTQEAVAALSQIEAHQIYNGLDSTTTFEVHERLTEQLASLSHPGPAATYHFKRAMLGPAMSMMRFGIRIDEGRKHELIEKLFIEREFLEARLNEITQAICDSDVNARSPTALQPIFYETLGIKPIEKRAKGETKTPMDLEILEKLLEFQLARPIAQLVLDIRSLGKQIGVLRSAVDPDGRMRTSFNVAATETERWSSSENAFGTGTNFQNLNDDMREIFIADPGKKLAYIDLSQAESFVVGLATYRCTGNDTYLQACESGDLHTNVCRMAWPDLPWPDEAKAARKMADEPFYRWFSYRDMSKRLGHASNLLGKPWGLAKKLRMEEEQVKSFQSSYLRGFAIDKWHKDVVKRLQTDGELTTILGNRRQFLGRLFDENNWRVAVAFEPQSVIAQVLNSGMYRVWKTLPEVQLLAQIHDAILVQYPESIEDQIIPKIQACMNVPLESVHQGQIRKTLIPNEAAVGWNWAKETKTNLDGLSKWVGNDKRKRTGNPEAGLLGRRLSPIHRRLPDT